MVKKKKKDNTMYLMYGIFIVGLFIISNYITKYTFEVSNYNISYNVILIPLILSSTYSLYKEFGLNKSLIIIILSTLFQLLAYFLEYILTDNIDWGIIAGTILSLPIAQLIVMGLSNVFSKKDNFFFIFLILIIAILVDNFIFINILNAFEEKIISTNMLIISNLFKIVFALLYTIIDSKTKKA